MNQQQSISTNLSIKPDWIQFIKIDIDRTVHDLKTVIGYFDLPNELKHVIKTA